MLFPKDAASTSTLRGSSKVHCASLQLSNSIFEAGYQGRLSTFPAWFIHAQHALFSSLPIPLLIVVIFDFRASAISDIPVGIIFFECTCPPTFRNHCHSLPFFCTFSFSRCYSLTLVLRSRRRLSFSRPTTTKCVRRISKMLIVVSDKYSGKLCCNGSTKTQRLLLQFVRSSSQRQMGQISVRSCGVL